MPRIDASIDAATLRVPELRALLQEHRVAVPSGARKAALVDLFDSHVRPILQQQATPDRPRAKRVQVPGPREDTPTSTPSSLRKRSRPQLAFGSPGMRTSAAQNSQDSQDSPTPSIRFAEENPFQALQTHSSARATVPKGTHTQVLPGTGTEPHTAPISTPKQRSRVFPPHWRTAALRWILWASACYWIWYCYRSRTIGYCDTNTSAATPHGIVPLAPPCTPCPTHGVCANGHVTSCTSADYTVADAAVSRIPVVSALVPLTWRPAQCVPDTYKLVLASELSAGIVEYLAQWHGSVRCGLAAPLRHVPEHALGKFAVPTATVRAELEARTVDDVDATLFSTLWDLALDGLLEHAPAEIVAITSARGTHWLATHRASMPLRCRIRLYIFALVWRSKLRVLITIVLVLATLYIVRRVRESRVLAVHVAAYARQVCAELCAQAQQHAASPQLPLGLPVAHLRDAVLEDELSSAARRKLWAHVTRVVEQNANVRARQAQWHGEWVRVWEWTGVVPNEGLSSPALHTPHTAEAAQPTGRAGEPSVPPRDTAHDAART
ncbi:hypothetical protein MVES1_000543 [Malassezia vespertilionis]|uniref:Src1p n=1 Tax=Malassezia vespertilionis TaxID=2020962 RepID=A0A2N1JH77_9BASI|nr:uncharacterized protein MVES1_000543 [Malassezia vespertilionis]PKI85904.1 Src1p [Malassezia vespertilionis]WFD05215.1 hypothetical protein MVES1_000543 [Malassezia vespertilionis]